MLFGGGLGVLASLPLLRRETVWITGSYDSNLNKSAGRTDYINAFAPEAESHLVFWEPLSNQVITLALPFVSHSVVQSPTEKSLGLAISRWGRSAAWLDLKNKVLRKIIRSPDGFRFFGHGVFALNGRMAFITGNSDDQKEGVIFGFEPGSNRPSLILSSGGIFPHEIAFDQTQKSLVTANLYQHTFLKTPGSISIVNPTSNEVLKSYPVAHATHFLTKSSGWLVGGKNQKTQILSFQEIFSRSQAISDLKIALIGDPSARGEVLSFIQNREWTLVTTANYQKLLAISRASVLKIDLPSAACGVAMVNQKIYVNSWNQEGTIYAVDLQRIGKDLVPQALARPQINGSHLHMIQTT